MHYNAEHGIINITWREKKTGEFQFIPIPEDIDWQLSFYNSVAVMRIAGNGIRHVKHHISNDTGERWLFNHMNNTSDFGKIINDALRSTVLAVEGLDPLISATSIRKGAIDTVLQCDFCDFRHACAISGHDMTNICALFEYVTMLEHWIYQASKVLAGWNMRDGIIGECASLESILITMQDVEKRCMYCFIKSAFNVVTGSLHDEGNRLWVLAKIYMATILKDLKNMYLVCHNHVVVITFCQIASKFGWNLQKLYTWGDIIR